MIVSGQEKSSIICVLPQIALKMFGNGIHKVLKFFNKPNMYLGILENQLKKTKKRWLHIQGNASMTDGICFIYVFTTMFMFCQEVCLGGAAHRGCAGSLHGEALDYVETETAPGFMGQARDTPNKGDGLNLMH